MPKKVQVPVQSQAPPDPRNALLQMVIQKPDYSNIYLTNGEKIECKFAIFDPMTQLFLCYKITEVIGVRKEDVKKVEWVKLPSDNNDKADSK